jgi:hypothetical protein
MNQETNMKFTPLNASAIKALCTETKETKVTSNQLKKFSVVDLWSIQKHRKSVVLRNTMAI